MKQKAPVSARVLRMYEALELLKEAKPAPCPCFLMAQATGWTLNYGDSATGIRGVNAPCYFGRDAKAHQTIIELEEMRNLDANVLQAQELSIAEVQLRRTPRAEARHNATVPAFKHDRIRQCCPDRGNWSIHC